MSEARPASGWGGLRRIDFSCSIYCLLTILLAHDPPKIPCYDRAHGIAGNLRAQGVGFLGAYLHSAARGMINNFHVKIFYEE